MIPAEESAHITRLIGDDRHIFIEASAGSGKTTRLVSLVAEIIRQGKARIHEILCVTFTEKAAAELKARIFARLARETGGPAAAALAEFSTNNIGTIHSFCRTALLEDAARSPDDGMEANADETEIFEEAREFVFRSTWPQIGTARLTAALDALEFGKKDFITGLRAFDAELKQKCLYLFGAPTTSIRPAISDDAGIAEPIDFKAWTILKIVERMHEITRGKNLMTFSGMIAGMAEAVQIETFAQKVRKKFRYALIDEFQDTDALQWQIFRTLFLSDKNRLIVVGDPKQAIYKFRGADVFVYLQAKEEMLRQGAFPDRLLFNHRSTPELLQTLDEIFLSPLPTGVWRGASIGYTVPERARSSDAASGVELYRPAPQDSFAAEDFARVVTDRIRSLRKTHPQWSIAVIAFKHRALETFARVLRAEGIEFAYYRQKPDFSRIEITHLKIFLQSFTLPFEDGLSLALKTLFLKAETDPAEYYRRLSAQAGDGRMLFFLQTLAQNLNPLRLILSFSPDTAIYHSWRVLMQKLLALCGKKIFDLESLRTTLYEMEENPGDEERQGDMLRSQAAVTLLTVASAKGLDWDMVVLADGITDMLWRSFPFFHDREGNAVVPADNAEFDRGDDKYMPIGEEARITQLNLLYVALTRARNKLIGIVLPPVKKDSAGPVGYFLPAWAETTQMPILELQAALSKIPPAGQGTNIPPEITEVAHGNIPNRIAERTSFSRLAVAEFSETHFIEDILPRGAGVGEILHNILENCDFAVFRNGVNPRARELMPPILAALGKIRRDGEDITAPVADRILEIIAACAGAALPLAGNTDSIRLCDVPPENLWREMPFWSAEQTHRVLREHDSGEVRRSMHGFMDLVFTVDERDYYILDYKSNSLSSVTPENIDGYTREHYGLQAEIYSEALAAYLRQNYPGDNRRVAGCYFLFLRYLKPGSGAGVHFTEAANG